MNSQQELAIDCAVIIQQMSLTVTDVSAPESYVPNFAFAFEFSRLSL